MIEDLPPMATGACDHRRNGESADVTIDASRPVAPVGAGHEIPPPDDDTANLQTMSNALGVSGYRILAAGNGASALAIVHRARPDLVPLDITASEITALN